MAESNPTNLSDEDPTKTCDPCSFRGVNTLAGTYCQVCSEYLCHSCEEYHRSSKASRDHELNPLEESHRFSVKQKALISSIMACDVHRTDTLTHFCVNHNVPICSACKSAKHRKCNTKTLNQVTKEAKVNKDVSLYIDKSKALLSEIKDIKYSREKDKCLIHYCSKQCIQQVKRIKLQIISWAENLTKDIEDKISIKENQLRAEMEGDIKALVEINKQMQDIVKSFEILGQDFEDASFLLMMKEKVNIEDSIAMKDDLLTQGKSVTLEFQQSERLVTLMSDIISMGKLEVNEKQINKYETSGRQEHQLCFKDISSTTNKKAIDIGTDCISGCVFMPDGKLVICDNRNSSVKVLTNDFKLKNDLKAGTHVWDVAVVSKTEVIVTEPDLKCLQFLNVSNGIKKGKSILVGFPYHGIDCKNDKLYVTCHDEYDHRGEVLVLTMDGITLDIIYVGPSYPNFLAVNNSGDIVITHCNDLYCIYSTDNTFVRYSDRNLETARGLLFDSYNNFMVCGAGSNNIHVVNSDGTQHIILLTGDDGLNSPVCLAYRPSDNTLIVGQCGNVESLLAFTIK